MSKRAHSSSSAGDAKRVAPLSGSSAAVLAAADDYARRIEAQPALLSGPQLDDIKAAITRLQAVEAMSDGVSAADWSKTVKLDFWLQIMVGRVGAYGEHGINTTHGALRPYLSQDDVRALAMTCKQLQRLQRQAVHAIYMWHGKMPQRPSHWEDLLACYRAYGTVNLSDPLRAAPRCRLVRIPHHSTAKAWERELMLRMLLRQIDPAKCALDLCTSNYRDDAFCKADLRQLLQPFNQIVVHDLAQLVRYMILFRNGLAGAAVPTTFILRPDPRWPRKPTDTAMIGTKNLDAARKAVAGVDRLAFKSAAYNIVANVQVLVANAAELAWVINTEIRAASAPDDDLGVRFAARVGTVDELACLAWLPCDLTKEEHQVRERAALRGWANSTPPCTSQVHFGDC